MKNKILSEELSIVIQGAVCGSAQGKNDYTKKVCESARKFFPDAEIILSTWEGARTEGLVYDKLVLSKNIDMTYIIRPDGNLCPNTVNHQIITSLQGISAASRRYVIKTRSDTVFTGDACTSYMSRFCRYSKDEKWRIFRNRIVALPTYNYRRGCVFPYNICDWFFLGTKEDLLNLFDIPLMPLEKLIVRPGCRYPRVLDNLGAEQYIWIACLRKNGHNVNLENATSQEGNSIENFEKSIADNFVLCSAKRLKLMNLKAPKSGYAAVPVVSQGLYTYCEWKRLYNKYGGGKLLFTHNIIEDGAYFLMYNLRCFVRRRFPEVYERIVSRIRMIRQGRRE